MHNVGNISSAATSFCTTIIISSYHAVFARYREASHTTAPIITDHRLGLFANIAVCSPHHFAHHPTAASLCHLNLKQSFMITVASTRTTSTTLQLNLLFFIIISLKVCFLDYVYIHHFAMTMSHY